MDFGLALPAAINGVRMIMEAYDGYERGRFLDTDRAVREEIRRRVLMLQDHARRLEQICHEAGDAAARREVQQMLTTLGSISDDAAFGVGGDTSSRHSAVPRLNKKARNTLVGHDLATLNHLVDCSRMANDTLQAIREDDLGSGGMVGTVGQLHDKVGRARNHFRERAMCIDGLRRD